MYTDLYFFTGSSSHFCKTDVTRLIKLSFILKNPDVLLLVAVGTFIKYDISSITTADNSEQASLSVMFLLPLWRRGKH